MGKCKTYYSYARFKSQWETSVHGGASRDLDGYHVLNPKGNIHHHILLDHQKVSKSQREYSSPDRHGRKVGVVYWFQIPTGNFSTTFLCLATSKINSNSPLYLCPNNVSYLCKALFFIFSKCCGF